MSLSIPEPIPIEPLTQERPRGSPCGAQAYTTRLTAESFEAIKNALLVQEHARIKERELSAKKGIPWATSKNEKHVVQLVVDETGKTSMMVGDKTFPVQAIQEKKGPEIVARKTTPMHRDSDTRELIPEHSSLHTVAQIVGRFQVTRFLDDNNAAQVREYTKSHEKERNSTVVLGNDEYMSQQHKRSTVKVEATQPASSTPAPHPAAVSSSSARSTKQSQASTSSAAPYLPVPDAEVPPKFKTLGLTIPRTWERENISLPLRTIHVMVLNKHTEAEISAEIEKYTGQKPPPGELHEILTRIATRNSSTGQWALRDPAYLYVRPFDYPDYDRSDRPAAVKATRPRLRALGYPDEGPQFEVLRRSTVLAAPMVTSLSMTSSENPGGVTTAQRTVDLEALKREAESNPAPTLKSNVKPGFFSSLTDTKKKKAPKTKESKEPKESKPKKTKAKRDDPDMKPRAPRENESSPAPAASSSKTTPKLEPEPHTDPKAPFIHAPARAGPGSAAGKRAAKKRLAEEAVMREQGTLVDSIQIPVLKATPKSAPPTARSSPTPTPLKPSLKRKSASDFSESPPKKRKVEMEEGEIDEAAPLAAGKGKAKVIQYDDEDDEYDRIVAQSMKKLRSVSDDEKPSLGWTDVKKVDDPGVRTSSKTKKQVMDDEYEDVKPTRKKATTASTPTAAKRRSTKVEDDEYGPKSASQRSVHFNTEVEEKSVTGIKKRKLAMVQEDDADYDDQRPKKKKKAVKAEPVEPPTSLRPKQRTSKDEYDIKGRLERARREAMPGAKRKVDADLVAATSSPPLKLIKTDEPLSQKAGKQSLRVMKAESPRTQPLKRSSTPAQPSGLRNIVASSAGEETKKTKKVKLGDAKLYAASPSSQPLRHPATKIANGKARASPASISAAAQCSVDGKKSVPIPPPDPAADHAATVMNLIDRRVLNTTEDLRSKFEKLVDLDNALSTFLEMDQHQLKEKRSASGQLKPGAASLFQKVKRMHELRHKLTMETQKVAHALQRVGDINDAKPVTTRQSVPQPDSPDDVISTRQRNLPVPEGITEEIEARHVESKQRWAEAQARRYSSQPTTPHRTPLLLPSSVPVRSPTLIPVAAPPPASIPGPSNHNSSVTINSSPPTQAPVARVSVTPQDSPTRSTPPAGTHPENKQNFQEVKTESKAFRRFRKIPPSASATPGAPGTPTVAGLQSQQALTYGNSSPSGSGLPAAAATPVTAATPIMSAPTPLANAATPAATAPTPGVAPSPVIPTVAVFSPVA